MKKITRALFLVLAVLTALTVVVTAYDLTTFKDYNKDHWANVALSHAVDNKLLGGYDDNTIRKDRSLTRAEMATVINRAFGASVHGPVTQFTDLKATDWYYNEIAKAVQMQTFGGTGSKIEADRAIFREEAMIVIARAMVLKDGNTEVLEKYNDYNEVSPWATGAIAALVEKGYVNGTNMNLVEPKAVVTRAQFAQIMYNIFSDYIQTTGTYSVNAERSLMINVPNVTLQNCTINGDLVLGDGVGKGYANITNVKVTGRILIRGGDKVTFKNVTAGEGIVVKNVNGTVNFQNYESEKIFTGITTYTPVTYLKRTPFIPSGPVSTKYTVTWKNWDGTTLETDTGVKKGTIPTYNSATPTKPADAQYTYTFAGWTPVISPVLGDVTYTAKFDPTLNTYTVIWQNWDGTELEKDENVPYGTPPTYDGATPTKPETDEHKYEFANSWTPSVSTVTGNAIYKANFTESDREYTLTLKYGEGVYFERALATEIKVTYNQKFDSLLPKDGFTKSGYAFDGWYAGSTPITADTTYADIKGATELTVKWTQEFTVKFLNGDGSEFDRQTVKIGGKATVPAGTPTKPADTETTIYGAFLDWDLGGIDLNNVQSHLTIKPIFEEEVRTYDLTLDYDGGTPNTPATIKVEFNKPFLGDLPTGITKDGYVFGGWYADTTLITATTTYADIKDISTTLKIKWTEEDETYTVIWQNWNGDELEKDENVPYGTTPSYDGATPERPATKQYTYTFKEWTPAPSPVTGDITYTADYTETPIYYTITFVTGNGEVIDPITDAMYNDEVAIRTDLTKENAFFKGWRVDADNSLITASPFDFLYEQNITLTAEWSDVYFTVEHYIPDGNGGYTLYGQPVKVGADIGDTVSAIDYAITIDEHAIDETKTTDTGVVTDPEDSVLTLAVYYRKLYRVTFYDKNSSELTAVKNLDDGDTVAESLFPDYTLEKAGYRTGPNRTHTAVDYIYSTEYKHMISFTWAYKNAEGDFEEFTDETEIYSDVDVYPYYKKSTLNLFVEKFKDIQGGEFIFQTFYDESRLVDSVKDVLWANKGAVIQAIQQTNIEEKLLEKLDSKGFITTNREILNQEQRIKLVTLIGDENLDEFVKTEAEKNVTEDNMTSFLHGYIHDKPDEATALLLDFLHLATQEDIDTIFKPAVRVFLDKDTHLLAEEAETYINSLLDEDIKELIEDEPEFVKSFIQNNQDIVVSYVNSNKGEIKTYINENKAALKADIDDYITDSMIETKIREYIAEKCLAGEYDALNVLIGVENGLYSDDMPVSHATIMSNFETILATEKDNIIAKIWEDEDYKKSLLEGDLYATIVVDEIMAKLNALVQEANATGDWTELNALIDKIDTTTPDIDSLIEFTVIENEIRVKLEGFTSGSTQRETIVAEILANVSRTDVETYFDNDKIKKYVNDLWTENDYAGLNSFFGVSNGIFSADMSFLGGQQAVTNVVINTILTDGTIKATVIDFVYDNYFDTAVDAALTDEDFIEVIVGKAVYNGTFMNSIIGTSVLGTAIDRILAERDPDVDDDDFDKAVDSVVATMTSTAVMPGSDPAITYKAHTINTIIDYLFDGNHGEQLDTAVDIVVHDIAKSNNPDVLALVEELSADVVAYLDNHPDKKDILVEMVVDDLYSATINTFTKQLRNEEQFTVHDNFSSLIAMAMYNKYSTMTIDGFIAEVKLPDAFNKVLSNDAIRDIVENIYNNSLTPYLDQLKDAHDKYEADPVDNKGTYYVDTFVTVKVDPIDELLYPLYNEFKPILEEKIDDKHYYKDNPYAVALVDFLSPDVLLNKMATNPDEEKFSGYTIPTAEELYTILYTTAVLADDAGKWYHDNVDKAKVDKAVDRLEDNILEYINTLIGFINEYKESGEIPEIDDLPDDKIRELLEKYDIQGIIDRTAQIQAIKDKIIANDRFNTVIDKFYNSKFNRELTGEDYDKAKKVLDFFFKNYQNEEFTLDELFDITLPDRFAEYKIDEDTYKVEVKGNTAEFVREIVKN